MESNGISEWQAQTSRGAAEGNATNRFRPRRQHGHQTQHRDQRRQQANRRSLSRSTTMRISATMKITKQTTNRAISK